MHYMQVAARLRTCLAPTVDLYWKLAHVRVVSKEYAGKISVKIRNKIYAEKMRIMPVSHMLIYKVPPHSLPNAFAVSREFFWGAFWPERITLVNTSHRKSPSAKYNAPKTRPWKAVSKGVSGKNKNLYAMSCKVKPSQTPEKRDSMSG